jgi:hypothetical protein
MSKRNESQSGTKGETLQTSANRPVSEHDQTESPEATARRFAEENIMLKAALADKAETITLLEDELKTHEDATAVIVAKAEQLNKEVEGLKAAQAEHIAAIEMLVEENNALRAQGATGVFVTDGATVEVLVPPTPPKPTLRETIVTLENRIEEAMSTAGQNKGRAVRPGPFTALLLTLQDFRRNHPGTPENPDSFLDLM